MILWGWYDQPGVFCDRILCDSIIIVCLYLCSCLLRSRDWSSRSNVPTGRCGLTAQACGRPQTSSCSSSLPPFKQTLFNHQASTLLCTYFFRLDRIEPFSFFLEREKDLSFPSFYLFNLYKKNCSFYYSFASYFCNSMDDES